MLFSNLILGISPMIGFLSGSLGVSSIVSESIASTLYHANWIVPICLLTYVSSIAWYQELADLIFKEAKGLSKDQPVTKTITNSTYGMVLWFVAFMQVQLLTSILPMLIDIIISVFFYNSATAYSLQFASLCLQFLGTLMNCCMYGWYGFDPYWYVFPLFDCNSIVYLSYYSL